MSRVARPASVAVAAVILLCSAGVAAVSAALRPHHGIGRLSLGMTFAEAKRLLGTPMVLNRRVATGFGREYVEYDWKYGTWIVGAEGRRGRLRVVKISTTLRTQRTRDGLGVGSRVADVVRRFPAATCRDMFPLGRWITVRGPNGRRTIFVTRSDGQPTPHPQPVSEVIVQSAVRPFGLRVSRACEAGWRRH